MSKVFICYSHKDKKYFDLINKHLSVNKKDIDIWSDTKIKGGDNWRKEIHESLDSCNLAVLILSANFFNSDFIQDVELKQLLENEFEKGTELLPILLEDCDIEAFSWIETNQILPSRNEPLETLKKKVLKTKLKEISQRVRELLAPVPDDSTTKDDVKSKNYPYNIAVNNFPESNDDFFGREKYFDILDKAWSDEQVNILSFIAFGGIGKTSLLDNWLKKMKKDHYRGAKNIFLWSFYSQGSEEDRQVTATEFLLEACKFFKIKNIPKTAYEQGRELADIISKQRALVVLDGLEPLQSSLEEIGEIKDNGLQVLLKKLSRQNKGLVVITSRIKLDSIDNQYEELETLEDFEGAELLKSFKLNGSTKDLEQISRDFDGHALALKLLGSYTKVVLDGDINRIDEIESLRDDKSKSSKYATRMLNSYKKYLKGTIELDILKLLSFFDRAISFEVINVLKNKPLIENINNSLIEVSEIDWKYALDTLKKLHLISSSKKVLDTHPLVREYFSEYIEDNFENSYIKGHYRLYKYYENLPEKELPDTIEEIQPLLQAIYHGCKAKRYLETYTLNTYRINRKSQANVEHFYLSDSLGEISSELKIISNYYNKPFTELIWGLDIRIKESVTSIAFINHVKLGKYKKALELMEVEKSQILFNSDKGLQSSINWGLLYLYLGKLNEAKDVLENAIVSKYTSDDYGRKGNLLSDYANVLFHKGEIEKAGEFFDKAEKDYVNGHRRNGVPIKFLSSTMGCDYIEYLIYIGTDPYVLLNRIKENMFFSKLYKFVLDMGLEYILLGKLKFIIGNKEKNVLECFNKGLQLIRKSNDYSNIVKSLLNLAKINIVYNHRIEANNYLEEVYDLIIQSESKLYLADWLIIAIEFELCNDIEKANTYFFEAKKLSKELNEYFFFKEELKKLESNFTKDI